MLVLKAGHSNQDVCNSAPSWGPKVALLDLEMAIFSLALPSLLILSLSVSVSGLTF